MLHIVAGVQGVARVDGVQGVDGVHLILIGCRRGVLAARSKFNYFLSLESSALPQRHSFASIIDNGY